MADLSEYGYNHEKATNRLEMVRARAEERSRKDYSKRKEIRKPTFSEIFRRDFIKRTFAGDLNTCKGTY